MTLRRRMPLAIRGVGAVDQGVIQEALGAEDTDLAAREDVVDGQRALSQRSAGLIAGESHVLEAGEQAGLRRACPGDPPGRSRPGLRAARACSNIRPAPGIRSVCPMGSKKRPLPVKVMSPLPSAPTFTPSNWNFGSLAPRPARLVTSCGDFRRGRRLGRLRQPAGLSALSMACWFCLQIRRAALRSAAF